MEFVIESDFMLTYELPFINKLKRKFGDKWEMVYNLHKDGNVPALNNLSKAMSSPIPIYKKESESKKSLIQKLKNHEKKNAA